VSDDDDNDDVEEDKVGPDATGLQRALVGYVCCTAGGIFIVELLHLRLRTRQLPTVTNCRRLAPLQRKTRLMAKNTTNSQEITKENILEKGKPNNTL